MNILIINHYAGAPSIGMEYRPYNLAYKWSINGHKVLIVAASYHHLRSKQFNVTRNITRHIIDGIDFLLLKTTKYNGNNYLP